MRKDKCTFELESPFSGSFENLRCPALRVSTQSVLWYHRNPKTRPQKNPQLPGKLQNPCARNPGCIQHQYEIEYALAAEESCSLLLLALHLVCTCFVCVTSRISKKLGVKVRTNLQSSTFRAVQSAEASCTFGEFGIMHVELWSLLLTSRESGTRLHIVPMPPMPRTRLRNKASAEEGMVLVVSHHKHVEKPRVTFFTRPVAETPVSIERPLQSKAPQKACRLRLRTALRQWSSKGPTLLRCPEQLPGIRASLGTLMLRLPCHRVKVHLATVLCASILHTANLHDHSPLPEKATAALDSCSCAANAGQRYELGISYICMANELCQVETTRDC